MSNGSILSLNIADLIKKAKQEAKNTTAESEGKEETDKTDSVSIYPDLEGYIKDQADNLYEKWPKEVEKLEKDSESLSKKIETLVNKDDKNNPNRKGDQHSVQVYLEDFLRLCAKSTLSIMAEETKVKVKEAEEEKLEKKPKVAYSFAQGETWQAPEDWELHHQYILEIFNPEITVYGPEKPEKDLKPGEKIVADPEELGPKPDSVIGFLGQVGFQLKRAGHWLLYQQWPDTPKKTVRLSEQAPKLNGIDVEDAPTKNIPDEAATKSLNLESKKVIKLMADDVYGGARGALQSDQIIELYDRAHKAKHRDSNTMNFLYPYTDYERKSPLLHKVVPSNAPEPRVVPALIGGAIGTFAGQVVSGALQASVRFGLELYPAVVFLVPQKCQTSPSS
ncbi:hypothetical protein [Rickettsiella endosymbiont of Rhagonycha lignosa]|uniref:hypothetical protein n=1 Tax=Rickettsiella endosymbiont of Rhagonycha lignosa TaxID=3077937 RepID=UPI00313DA45D